MNQSSVTAPNRKGMCVGVITRITEQKIKMAVKTAETEERRTQAVVTQTRFYPCILLEYLYKVTKYPYRGRDSQLPYRDSNQVSEDFSSLLLPTQRVTSTAFKVISLGIIGVRYRQSGAI
jgi:hypothetical protein